MKGALRLIEERDDDDDGLRQGAKEGQEKGEFETWD